MKPGYDLLTLGETLLRLSPPGMQRLDQARMAMSEADSGIGAHHVDVAPSPVVPQMDAVAAHNRDGKRRIIAGAETGLEVAIAHDTLRRKTGCLCPSYMPLVTDIYGLYGVIGTLRETAG